MHAGRCKSDYHVAGRDIVARQQILAAHRAHGETGKVVVAGLIHAGHFRCLTADQRAARFAASGGNAFDHHRSDRGIELAAGEVVEEEQRLGPLHHEVVDRHRDEIDADGIVTRCLDRDLDLGADAVGCGDKNRIGEAGCLEIEQAAEAADLGFCAGSCGSAHQRLDQFHHAVAGIDIDAGGRVARLFHGPTNRQISLPAGGGGLLGASYVGIGGCASTRLSYIVLVQDDASRPKLPVSARRQPGPAFLSIPNLISLARIILVPIVVWAITSDEMLAAFALFLVAGISDAVDGFLAKRFHMASELGAYLDPLADKALIVSIYVALGIAGALAIPLVILVVSRDIMIISGFMLSWLVGKPMPIRPLPVSKANTVAQILLATLVLAEHGFGFDAKLIVTVVAGLVAVLTLLSIAFYLAEWLRHMNSFGTGH